MRPDDVNINSAVSDSEDEISYYYQRNLVSYLRLKKKFQRKECKVLLREENKII